MAQPREKDHSASVESARARVRNRVVVYPTKSKKSAQKIQNEDVAEITLSQSRFKHIIGNRQIVSKLLANYADVLAKVEREGRTATITFRLSPDGKAELLNNENGGDELDRALASAKARGQEKIFDILKGEEMLNARQFSPLINASHETINAKRKKGEVLGLEGATRGVRYPSWQVTGNGLPLPGLADLFSVLGNQPWTVYRFLLAQHSELGGRNAVDALKNNEIEAVLGVARNQNTGVYS